MRNYFVRYENSNLACCNIEHIISVKSFCSALITACKIRIHAKDYGNARNIRVTMYNTTKPDEPAKVVFKTKKR